MSESKLEVIAFYLPQFHPFPENDEWWGKGFTEWTNVGRARPLFPGHEQPKVPADLGYYDLRLPQVREAQAAMAKQYGVTGFCYYHYWFGDGKQLLDMPFKEVLKSGEPDFPFMLCWANESWHSKFWDKNAVVSKKLLIEQKYGDLQDYEKHFYSLLPAFQDPRYIRIDGKPAFMLYRPLGIPDAPQFINLWQTLAQENGLKGIYFIGQTTSANEKEEILVRSFNAVNIVRHYDVLRKRSFLEKCLSRIIRSIFKIPICYSYAKAFPSFIGKEENDDNVFPTLLPNWDHTPRSGAGGYVLTNSTPTYFSKHVDQVLSIIVRKKKGQQISFLKSWNEWGEGNYMEPDLKYGTQYLEALLETLKKYNGISKN